MEHRFFSVIIPLYNKEEFVERGIHSVLAQSYPHFELIVVDDGSVDKGPERVKTINDSRIRLISQANAGVSVARNVGVQHAKYDHVVFLDADDTWNQDFLAEINRLITNFPDAGLYGTNITYRYMDRDDWSIDFSTLFGGNERGVIPDYYDFFAKLERSPFSNSSTCIPVSVFNKVGGYMAGVRLTEDSDIWCRIALRHPVAFSIIPLVTYYAETVNNTRKTMEYKEFQVTLTLKSFLQDQSVDEGKRKSIQKLIAFQQLSLVRRAFLNDTRAFALRMLFKKELVLHYPQYFILYPLLAVFPASWVVYVNKIIKNILTSR
jgi:glycosyltransferase involved in cell wall biosynthesis